MPEVKFVPDCALDYAKANKIRLPKKAKDDPDLLLEVMHEEIDRRSKEALGDESPFECEQCHKTVLEPDLFCWHCGFDVSDDGSGGWKPPAEKKTATKKTATKKTEEKKTEEKPEETTEDPDPSPEEIEAAVEGEEEATGERKEYSEPSVGETPVEAETPVDKKSLEAYTLSIVRRDGDSGHGAWLIGRDLLEVDADNLYLDGGFDTLEDYAAADLAISWKMALDYMRISGALTEEQSKQVGIFKLKMIAAVQDDKHRARLLNAGTAKALGGEGFNRDQLQDLRNQLEGKGGDEGGGGGADGKKKRSPFLKLIKEGTFEGRRTEDRLAIDLDDEVTLRVEVLKNKGKAWFEKRED
jgi:hypothetical protein